MKKVNEMKKINQRIATLMTIMLTVAMMLTACGQAADETEVKEETVLEEAGETTEPLAEEDLDGILTGIEDHYVLQDAKNVDYMHGVTYDTAIELEDNKSDAANFEESVKGVKIIHSVIADDSAVKSDTPGVYSITYTVKVNRPAYNEYMALKEEDETNSETVDTEGKLTEIVDEPEDKVDEKDLQDVVIKKEIEVVNQERAKELVESGESVWADESRDYGEILKEQEAQVEEKSADTSAKAGMVAGEGPENTIAENEDSNSNISGNINRNSTTSSGSKSGSGTSSSSNSGSSSSSSKSIVCDHNWVATKHEATGHYEKVLVSAAYDEKVENGSAYVCNKCGYTTQNSSDILLHCKPTTSNAQARCDEKGTSYSVRTQYTTVHHDAVYENKWVQDSAAYTTYKCSKCGATK